MNLIPIRNEILFTTMSQTLNSISHLTRIEFEVPFGLKLLVIDTKVPCNKIYHFIPAQYCRAALPLDAVVIPCGQGVHEDEPNFA